MTNRKATTTLTTADTKVDVGEGNRFKHREYQSDQFAVKTIV